jgi:hypothetical protein
VLPAEDVVHYIRHQALINQRSQIMPDENENTTPENEPLPAPVPADPPAFDMSIYDKLEEDFDRKMAGIGEGSTEEELAMTKPVSKDTVNGHVKNLVEKSRESSAAYYKEMLAIARAGLSVIAAGA